MCDVNRGLAVEGREHEVKVGDRFEWTVPGSVFDTVVDTIARIDGDLLYSTDGHGGEGLFATKAQLANTVASGKIRHLPRSPDPAKLLCECGAEAVTYREMSLAMLKCGCTVTPCLACWNTESHVWDARHQALKHAETESTTIRIGHDSSWQRYKQRAHRHEQARLEALAAKQDAHHCDCGGVLGHADTIYCYRPACVCLQRACVTCGPKLVREEEVTRLTDAFPAGVRFTADTWVRRTR